MHPHPFFIGVPVEFLGTHLNDHGFRRAKFEVTYPTGKKIVGYSSNNISQAIKVATAISLRNQKREKVAYRGFVGGTRESKLAKAEILDPTGISALSDAANALEITAAPLGGLTYGRTQRDPDSCRTVFVPFIALP